MLSHAYPPVLEGNSVDPGDPLDAPPTAAGHEEASRNYDMTPQDIRTSREQGMHQELGQQKTMDLHTALHRLSASFFFLGLLNNVLYVIILSAALDLVPPDVPKGVILFVNITPALLVKLGWPYFVPGRVRYGRRVTACSLISFIGILLVALSSSLSPRLFGIALASFASGLGEMTFLQRTTCYGNDDYARLAVGWFSSGTGAAGLVGAGLWWELRSLGVKTGISVSSVLPVCMGVVYFLLLPKSQALRNHSSEYTVIPNTDDDLEDAETSVPNTRDGQIRASEEEDDDAVDDAATVLVSPVAGVGTMENLPLLKPKLSTSQKLDLAKPLVLPFMIPLFIVYFAEYTVNTGISPTLLYPIPNRIQHPWLGSIIKKLSDYYPLWQLVYQTFVFFSRSSTVIFRIPPLPAHLVALPSMLQFGVLLVAILEATKAIFTSLFGPTYAIGACFVLIAMEGLCGGTAYVNAYLRVGLIEDEGEDVDRAEKLARREFRMACVGFADTLGIVAASLMSSWLEPTLCNTQVEQGRDLCREVK